MNSAVVTGAGSGIGGAVTRRLLADGWAIVAVDQDADGLARFADEPNCATVVGDVAERSTHVRAGQMLSEIGSPLGWVSVAGITATHELDALDEESARRMIDVNQIGPLLGAAEAVTRFRASGNPGVIVQISSVHGSHAAVHYPVYEMTKAATEALTRSIAVSYGADGIRSVAIAPGAVETPALTAALESSGSPPSARARLEASSPLHRLGQPSEIADAVAFALSTSASFLTGTTVVVDGGWTAVLLDDEDRPDRRGPGPAN